MKLSTDQTALGDHLSLVSKAVPSKPNHPILGNILLEADNNTLNLTAYDYSLGIRSTLECSVEQAGRIALPAKLLTEIISHLPSGAIALETPDEYALTLTSASGRYQIRGMSADEFPTLPEVQATAHCSHITAAALIEGLLGSLVAAASEETKQVLTGIHICVEPEAMEFAATDGHRLAVVHSRNQDSVSTQDASAKCEKPHSSLEVTVPKRALEELKRMASDLKSTELVCCRFESNQAVFELPNKQRLTSRLLEGQYPNYRQLIPRSFSQQVTVDRRGLCKALERVAVLTDKRNVVKLTIDHANQQLNLAVTTIDVGSGVESIAAQVTGDTSLDIAFNVKYLMDGLKALPSERVTIQLNTASSPVILTPMGLKITYLLMPIQLA